MKRVHVVVHGEVQGVGYRYTARGVAGRLGVTGWIRNRWDGTVEAHVQGPADRVAAMLAWMADGPPGARVDGCRVTDIPVENAEGFRVLQTA